jgi:hypothetical protein
MFLIGIFACLHSVRILRWQWLVSVQVNTTYLHLLDQFCVTLTKLNNFLRNILSDYTERLFLVRCWKLIRVTEIFALSSMPGFLVFSLCSTTWGICGAAYIINLAYFYLRSTVQSQVTYLSKSNSFFNILRSNMLAWFRLLDIDPIMRRMTGRFTLCCNILPYK